MYISSNMPFISSTQSILYKYKPSTQRQGLLFAGPADTFQKRLERDELAFSTDLKTVLDFYESLPFKTVFQSKENRERLERLMIQKEHATYSQKVLKRAANGGTFMKRLFQESWKEKGISEEKQKAIFKKSVETEGLSIEPDTSIDDMAKLLGQYYSHEANEAVGNNYGVGELSEQAKDDAQKILHSGVGSLAKSIRFIKNDLDMARIVQNRQLLTNPTPANLEAALDDWSSLFQEGTSARSTVQFGARTSKYGKPRHNKRETAGIIALSILGGTLISLIPIAGYYANNLMHKKYTFDKLTTAYKLNLPSPPLEKDIKKVQNFVQTTQRIEKASNTIITGTAGSLSAGLSLPLTMALGAFSGLISEAYGLRYAAREMAKYSQNLYDALEDYPNVKIGNKVHTPSEVYDTLKSFDSKKGTSEADIYETFKSQSYGKDDLEQVYNNNLRDKKNTRIFTKKSDIDQKTEVTPLFRHILHLQKQINTEHFKIDLPLKFLSEHKGVFKFLKVLSTDDDGFDDDGDA